MTSFNIPFMFDCGAVRGMPFIFSMEGRILGLTEDDINNYREENALSDDNIKTIAYAFLAKQGFADFSSTILTEVVS